MSIIANRMAAIKPSPTLALNEKAIKLKAEGHDVIALTIGELDFDTPDHIKQATKDSLDRGETKYTAVAGIKALREAIMKKFKEENHLDYSFNEVMANIGGKHAIYNALMASMNDGDEVIIPAPYWVSYPDMVLLSGGQPVIVKTTQENGFRMTAKDFEAAITPKTKWLILNSPSNPTGAAYDRASLKALAEVLERHPHVWVMSDDIYEALVFDGEGYLNILNVAPSLKNRTLIVNGLAKSYSMTGWRLGFAAGPKELIDAMTILQSQSTSNPPTMLQAAAIAALTQPKTFIEEWKTICKTRRDYVWQRLQNTPGLNCYHSEGTFYLYPSCADLIGKKTPSGQVIRNDTDFVSYLLDEYNVAVVPGSAFGLEPYFRFSYATSEENLQKACDRIEQACQSLLSEAA